MIKNKILTTKEKLAFSATAVGKNLVYFLVATYYMYYLTQVQNLSGTVVGIVFGLSRVFDAINDPVMGTIVDNTRTSIGKFRPWILLGTILNTIVLLLMFVPFNDSAIAFRYIFYLSLYVLWGMTYTLMDVPYWSMIPSIALNTRDKNSISSYSQLAAGLGSIIIIAVMPFVFKYYGSALEPRAYMYPSLVIGGVFIVLTGITVLIVEEKTSFKYSKIKLREVFSIVYRNDQLLAYIIIMMSILTSSTLLISFSTYFFSFILKDYTLQLFGIFTIVAGVSQAVGIISFPAIARRFPKERIFYFAGFGSIFGLVLMFLLTISNLAANIILLSIVGIIILFGFGWMMVISVVMLADIVDYGEVKLGKRTESIVFSMKTLVQKFAAALAAAIIGIAVDLAGIGGKDPALLNMTVSSNIIIRSVMFAMPILFILLGLFFYKTKYKLDEIKSKVVKN